MKKGVSKKDIVNPHFIRVGKSVLTQDAINDMFIAKMDEGRTLFFYIEDVHMFQRRKIIQVYGCMELADDKSGWLEYTDQEIELDEGVFRPDSMPSLYALEIEELFQPRNKDLADTDVKALWINPELEFEAINCHGTMTSGIVHDKNCDAELHEGLSVIYTAAVNKTIPKDQSQYVKAISAIMNFIQQKEYNMEVVRALELLYNAVIKPARSRNDTQYILRSRALETLRSFIRSHGGRIP